MPAAKSEFSAHFPEFLSHRNFKEMEALGLSLTMLKPQSVHFYSVMKTMEHDVMGYKDR